MNENQKKITLVKNGPALIEVGEVEIIYPDGSKETKPGKFSLCRCGESKKKPFCDGTHNTCGFEG